MVVPIPDSGIAFESSAKPVAGLPTQAFALTLSDSMLENMIECVQNGGNIQLSLGGNPSFLFGGQEIAIPESPDAFEYDLYHSNSASPHTVQKLQYPAMPILSLPSKFKPKVYKPLPGKGDKSDKASARNSTPKPGNSTPRLAAVSDKGLETTEDDAIVNLKNSLARAEAEKHNNSAVVVDGIISTKTAKGKQGKGKLLGAPSSNTPRSHPGSPALGALASPSLGPTSNPSQDRLKQQRFPIIHELAVQELSFDQLFSKWTEGPDSEFSTVLKKVADFDEGLQKWVLKKLYWKELDVFEYSYSSEDDRQKAIDNAIKQYDRMRLGASDPLWQKLLPKPERNKGTCLSKLQAAFANKAAAAPRINVQKPDASSPSGGDSEKDDSTSSAAKKAKGGEPMSRSSSQSMSGKKKPSASEAQQKRLLSNQKKPTTTAAKTSPTKPAAAAAAAAKSTGAKGARVLSKEFVSDSDSDDDEVPLSTSLPRKNASGPATKPSDRADETHKVAERAREAPALKPKPAVAARPAVKQGERERDTIRAQVIAKPTKAPIKRQRDADDDDDSSSSGTPLSKRLKPVSKAQPAPAAPPVKKRAPSDASRDSRASSGLSMTKSKNTSPVKSSPLAVSPPTNASELDRDRPRIVRDGGRGRERERDLERDLKGHRSESSAGGSTGGSSVTSNGASTGHSTSGSVGKKRPADESSPESKAKRQKLSQEILNKANKFKQFYSRYEALHREIWATKNPPPQRVADLIDMRSRLENMKKEIYGAVVV